MNHSAARSTESSIVKVRFPDEELDPAQNRRSRLYRTAAHVLTFISGAACLLSFQLYSKGTDHDLSRRQHGATGRVSNEPVPLSESKAFPVAPPMPITDAVTPPKPAPVVSAPEASDGLRVMGITEPASGRFVKLPLATSQPVAFVDVKLGDRIKKGWQVFSHWESPERLRAAKSELARTKKMLEVARERSAAAAKSFERIRRLDGNVISAEQLQSAESTARIRRRELEAAELTVAESESQFAALEFEFNQAFVTSPIDGVVTCVDVVPGERRQLGNTFRGVTVLDSRVLTCRCLMNGQQIQMLRGMIGSDKTEPTANETAGQPVHRRVRVVIGANGKEWNGALNWIGIQAEVNRLIPVVVEFQNPAQEVACGIEVNVVFSRSRTLQE